MEIMTQQETLAVCQGECEERQRKGQTVKKKLSKHAFPARSSETLDADKDDSNLHSSTSVSSLSLCVSTHLRWVVPHKSRGVYFFITT